MASKLVALSVAAAALLMASSVFDPADARRGGGGGGGGGGFRAGGGGPSMGMRPMGARSFTGGNMGRVYRGGGGQAFRAYGGNVQAFHRGHRHGHRHRFHRRFIVGVPLGAYGYYSSYGDGCEWLRQRALYTGSAYWWDRYNACLYGYGDY